MNKATGNMYEGWVTHTWNPLNGECSHRCPYCFVKNTPAGRMGFYSGPLRLNDRAMQEGLGKGRKIFVVDLNDLFAAPVPDGWIRAILERCHNFGHNEYIFQTKNPLRYLRLPLPFPPRTIIGTTIESDMMPASVVGDRIFAMRAARDCAWQTFITIEPIQKFSMFFADTILSAKPSFVNIGADSKNSGLPEPTGDEVRKLIADLRAAGIEVREKANLKRILK
jgi:DNA repair photolyase